MRGQTLVVGTFLEVARLQFGIGSSAGRSIPKGRFSSIAILWNRRVGCALAVWNSTPHSFNVRLEVLIFPSGLTEVTEA